MAGPDAPLKDFGWKLSAKDQTMTFRHLANMTSGYGRPQAASAVFAYNDYAIQLYQLTLFDKVFRAAPEAVANDARRLGALGLEDGLQFRANVRRISASVRDFARITCFRLNRGNWNGKQILPERFFQDYLKPQVPAGLPFTQPAETDDYLQVGSHGVGSDQVRDARPGNCGFNWWLNEMGKRLTWPDLPRDAFPSLGARGNNTFIIPSLKVVLVSASGNWSSFIPGDANTRMNGNLRLLMQALRRTPPGNVTTGQNHPRDFSFFAAVEGNRFDVEIAGAFTGPDNTHLRVPGFHDGDGVWKIRFAPTRQGEWSMRTASSLEALDGKTESGIWCSPNRHAAIHGGLRVDAAHPYHFGYEDGTRYFLLGYEADWLWGADVEDPERKLMPRLIDQMASRGFNHVMVNVYAYDTRWSPERKHQWGWGPALIYPWEGNNQKPDHSRLNSRFFQICDGMMSALREKGIVAHIMLKVYNKYVKWPSPYGHDEERYFRYVAVRYLAFPNVVWDFFKEAHNEKDPNLQRHLTELMCGTDAYQRLVTAHGDDAFYSTPEFYRTSDFRTDQQHTFWPEMIAFDRAMRKYLVLNWEFGYERGVDKMPPCRTEHNWEAQPRRAYLIYLARGYGVSYYHNTAWYQFKPIPEPPGMRRFQLLKDILSVLPYCRMEPHNELAVGGPCLALPGEAYAFFVKGSQLTINLLDLEEPAKARAGCIDTWTGARERVNVGAAVMRLLEKPPAFVKALALLIVRH